MKQNQLIFSFVFAYGKSIFFFIYFSDEKICPSKINIYIWKCANTVVIVISVRGPFIFRILGIKNCVSCFSLISLYKMGDAKCKGS